MKDANHTQKETFFVDERDGKKYRKMRIGNQVIMAENLAYKPSSGNYWAYDNNQANISRYGCLYDWETAKEAAEGLKGWHLPTKEDWEVFHNYIHGNALEIRETMLEVGMDIGSWFAGRYSPQHGEFGGKGINASFWSATLNGNLCAWYFACRIAGGQTGIYFWNMDCGCSVLLFQD